MVWACLGHGFMVARFWDTLANGEAWDLVGCFGQMASFQHPNTWELCIAYLQLMLLGVWGLESRWLNGGLSFVYFCHVLSNFV